MHVSEGIFLPTSMFSIAGFPVTLFRANLMPDLTPDFIPDFVSRGVKIVPREIIAELVGALDEISSRELHRAQNRFFAHILYMKSSL